MQHFWSEDIRKAGTCSFSRLLTACRLQLNFDHTVENTDIWSMQDLLSPGDSPVFHEVTVVTSSQLLAIKALCNFWLSKALKKPAETCRGNIDVGMNAVSGTTCVKSMEKKKTNKRTRVKRMTCADNEVSCQRQSPENSKNEDWVVYIKTRRPALLSVSSQLSDSSAEAPAFLKSGRRKAAAYHIRHSFSCVSNRTTDVHFKQTTKNRQHAGTSPKIYRDFRLLLASNDHFIYQAGSHKRSVWRLVCHHQPKNLRDMTGIW